MTHAIKSNTNLLSIDITRTHTQMRKSPRGETEGKKGRKEKKFYLNKRKKERKKKKKDINE